MKKLNKFLTKLNAFEITTAKEASAARTDLLCLSDKKELIKDLCLIYDKYNYWLKLYGNKHETDFSNEIALFKFRAFIGWSFRCGRYGNEEITKDLFREIWTIVATNRDNILLSFKDLPEWRPTPKDELSPEWLKVAPTIYLMFTGNNKSLADNPLIFDNNILADLYQRCNDVMFEDVKYPEFENWFRVEPIGKPTIKGKGNTSKATEFCGILGTIEEKREEGLVSDFAKWVEKIGIGHYGIKKGRAANYKRKEQIK
jgi:hypothetical protein